MTCRIFLRLGIVILLGTLCSSRLAYAQSQSCAEIAPQSRVPVQKTRITIIGVEFEGETPVSEALRAQLVEDIKHSELWVTPEELDSTWVSQALNPIRDAILSQGYFRTNVEGTPYLVRAEAKERLYVLRVTIDRGPQYRLGNLQFASASESPLVITDALLRQQIQLHEGDLFDVSKIREGLEAIGRLYGSKGYIDATPGPDTTIDESGSRIDLLIKVDEQKPYRISKIEVLGLGTATQKYLRIPQETGDVFNSILWRDFFKDNGPHLPADASPDKNLRMQRNVGKGTLDITFDFRPCPQTQP
jgi:outer membrane protein assembly factor BamA